MEEFRAHYEKENKERGKSNKYDDPATNDLPNAAFSIINEVHKNGEKATEDESTLEGIIIEMKPRPKKDH